MRTDSGGTLSIIAQTGFPLTKEIRSSFRKTQGNKLNPKNKN